jgi:hypothetical protein
MAHTGEIFILVSRACIDINTDAREVTWQSLCCNSNAIGEGGDLVEFNRVLKIVSRMKDAGTTRLKYTLSCDTKDANRREFLGADFISRDTARVVVGRNILKVVDARLLTLRFSES